MGYKLLGYLVWRGGKAYARHRVRAARRGLLVGGVAAAALLGGAVLARRRSRS